MSEQTDLRPGKETGRSIAVKAAPAIAIAIAMAVVRLPLCTEPGVRLGWNSDAAIYGLIARSMMRDHRLVFFFWAEDYVGTLTSFFTIMGAAVVGAITPLALRIGATVQVAVSLALSWHALRRTWGTQAASIAVACLITGPRYFFDLSYAPLSAEQMLFVGSIVLWYGTSRPLERPPQWAVLGFLGGIGWWAHRGAFLAIVPVVAAGFVFDTPIAWRNRLHNALAFGGGLAAGLIPWALGRAQIDQYLYAPVTAATTLSRIAHRVTETATVDFWGFLGARSTILGVAPAIALLVLFLAGMSKIKWARCDFILIGTLATSFGFWIISPQAYSGALRYLCLALPIFLGVCGLGAVTMWRSGSRLMRISAPALVVVVAVSLCADRIADVRTIVAGQGEQHEHWPGGFDPRPALAQIDSAGYRVCYADFWLAYKLEWLSHSGVQFIPYRSVNRTQKRSLELSALNGPQCYVSNNGLVRTLSRPEQLRFRAETIAAIQRANRAQHRH